MDLVKAAVQCLASLTKLIDTLTAMAQKDLNRPDKG